MAFPVQASKPGDCAVASSAGEEPGGPTGTGQPSAKRTSIGQVMMIIALVTVNLATLRATPMEIVTYPSIWVILGTIDFVVLWKLILKRYLRAFHYTFLIAFVVAYFVLALLVTTERLHPLGVLVRGYQHLAGDDADVISPGYLWIGEVWFAGFLSFSLAWALGLGATWLERSRNWDIAACFRGALVGFGIAALLLTLADVSASGGIVSAAPLTARLVVLGCVILGVWMGLSRMKSKMSGGDIHGGHEGSSPGPSSHRA